MLKTVVTIILISVVYGRPEGNSSESHESIESNESEEKSSEEHFHGGFI
jgi:hypothetical protein